MAYRYSRRSRGGSGRTRRTSARRYRWVVLTGSNVVAPATYQAVDLLTPIQPASTVADLIYQQMTKPTLIRLMGHMTLVINNGFNITGPTNPFGVDYGWGIYRDVDFTSSGTALPAFSDGYSNSWMVHKVGFLSSIGTYAQDVPTQSFGITPGNTDIQYRRYELDLRKYKRTLDSFNDTLVLSVENATPAGATAGTLFYSFYFRVLLLE